MLDLWSKMTGMILVELTSADPEQLLNRLAAERIAVWDVRRCSGLVLQIRIRRGDWPQLCRIGQKMGANLRPIGFSGFLFTAKAWLKRPLLILTIILLTLLTLYLPERILFVEVMGNEQVPARLILEEATQLGLSFGSSRRQIRSEAIKNELLQAIDSLEWVGVNTQGCTALISVRERKKESVEDPAGYSVLVAATDGVIEKISLYRGTLQCEIGQAVNAGDILVSGYQDLGICSRTVDAQGEIYALTGRQLEIVSANVVQTRGAEVDEILQIALIFGKKRINLYSDSGILPSGCGKMTYNYPIMLPGGKPIPVTLVIERILCYDIQNAMRTETESEELMLQAARKDLLTHTIAGQILTWQTRMEYNESRSVLAGMFQCREMIARRVDGITWEGDTHDDSQNSERGTG